MITQAGLENLSTETFGTLEEYTTSFYHFLNVELSAENKAGLEPFIAQAHAKGIPTSKLVEIVKSGMS
jgi:hypothetical protein